MHTFVVRIFGSQRDEAELTGTVDDVSSGLTATFHDAGELVTILSQSDSRPDAKPGAAMAEDSEVGAAPGTGERGMRLVQGGRTAGQP